LGGSLFAPKRAENSEVFYGCAIAIAEMKVLSPAVIFERRRRRDHAVVQNEKDCWH
jgi:hypothetical protein